GLDDVRALLRRAVAHVSEVGWQRAAENFNSGSGGFRDRDALLVAIDADDRYLVMTANPSLDGTSVRDLIAADSADIDDYLKKARGTAADLGEGWIEYMMPDSATGRPQQKIGFVADLGDGGFIGCSIARAHSATPALAF